MLGGFIVCLYCLVLMLVPCLIVLAMTFFDLCCATWLRGFLVCDRSLLVVGLRLVD